MTAHGAVPGTAAAPSRARWRRDPRRAVRSLGWHVGALLILCVVLYPVVWVVGATFKDGRKIIGSTELLPAQPVLDNLERLTEGLGGYPLWAFFVNSAMLACGAVLGVLFSCSLAAYAFARIRFAGRNVLFAMMISTLLLPVHVMLIPQYILFQKLALVDTYVPLLIGKYLAAEAFFIFLMVQFMRGVPLELDEAARLDGCGHGRIYWSVVLPLCRPALITSAIFTFIWTWNDFMGPLIYLNDPGNYPVSMALKMFMDEGTLADYGGMMAMSLMALLPVLLFFLAFQRFLVEGATTSGLKG
ncbi:carbohydrate ABC transporter permease [Streptomyces sp. NPDC054796]